MEYLFENYNNLAAGMSTEASGRSYRLPRNVISNLLCNSSIYDIGFQRNSIPKTYTIQLTFNRLCIQVPINDFTRISDSA